MTRDPALPVLVRVLGVPTTRNVRGIPSELSVGPDDGLSTECVLTFDNLRLLWKPYLTRRITTLPVHRWPEVCAALLFTVAC